MSFSAPPDWAVGSDGYYDRTAPDFETSCRITVNVLCKSL